MRHLIPSHHPASISHLRQVAKRIWAGAWLCGTTLILVVLVLGGVGWAGLAAIVVLLFERAILPLLLREPLQSEYRAVWLSLMNDPGTAAWVLAVVVAIGVLQLIVAILIDAGVIR